MNDDFEDVINNTEVVIKQKPFDLYKIKVNYCHWFSGDIMIGQPVRTSLILNRYEKSKIIEHSYYGYEDSHEIVTDVEKNDFPDCDKLFNKLKNIDLRNLKNNYFTNSNPESFRHWEVEYNDYFKISGTFDQMPEEITNIFDILKIDKLAKEKTRDFMKREAVPYEDDGTIY